MTPEVKPSKKSPSSVVCVEASPRGASGNAGDGGGGGNNNNAAASDAGMLDIRFGESVADTLGMLYSDPVAAIQEIVANGVAACKAARDMYPGECDPYIRVHVTGRNIAIEDRDSLGMPWDVFRDAYARAGTSLKLGSDGSRTPGLFGCGSLSYVLVSDIMFLESHSRATGEKYGVMACDGRGFQTGLATRDIEWYGTRVRLTIRRDVSMSSILERIATIVATCGVRIEVELDNADPSCMRREPSPPVVVVRDDGVEVGLDDDDDDDDGNGYGHGNHNLGAPAVRLAEPVTDRISYAACTWSRLAENYARKRSVPIGAGCGDDVCIRAETDDIEVAAFATCGDGDTSPHKSPMWLAGMPIGSLYSQSDDGLFSWRNGWDVWIHCKNERKYRPTPDRERFPADTFDAIVAETDRLLRGRLAAVRPRTLAEYIADPANRILEPYATPATEVQRESKKHVGSMVNTPYDRNRDADVIDKAFLRIARAAGPVVVRSGGRGTSLWKVVHGWKPGDDMDGDGKNANGADSGIARIAVPTPRLIVAPAINNRLKKMVFHKACADGEDGRVVLFAPHRLNTLSVEDYVEMGCERAMDYLGYGEAAAADYDAAVNGGRNVRGGVVSTAAAASTSAAARKVRCGKARRPPAKGHRYVIHYGEWTRNSDCASVPTLKKDNVPVGCDVIGRRIVRCDDTDSFAAMRSLLAALACEHTCATREQSDVEGFDDFADYACGGGSGSKGTYATSMGRLSGTDLAKACRGNMRAVLVPYDRPADVCDHLAGLVPNGDGGKAVYVFGDRDDLARCGAHLWTAGANYTVWMLPIHSDASYGFLIDKSYMDGIVERKASPSSAAEEWFRGIIEEKSRYDRQSRTERMEMLHSHLVGARLMGWPDKKRLRAGGDNDDSGDDSAGGGA